MINTADIISKEQRLSPVPYSQSPVTCHLILDPADFAASFNRRAFAIRHHLAEHPLFDLPRLARLASLLPESDVEYNAGDIPVDQDPDLTPRTGLSIDETIRRIEQCGSWMALKRVERDPEYAELLNRCLDEVQVLSEAHSPGMCKRQAFIFISSPGSVTPYHMDPEYNFLLQIRGSKVMHVFDGADRAILSETELEQYLSGGHRNLRFKEETNPKAAAFDLAPGDGLHVPVTSPHWVKNGPEVSISFSITFRTPASERRTVVYTANAALRRLGLDPAPYAGSGLRDAGKYHAFRALRRLKRRMKAEG